MNILSLICYLIAALLSVKLISKYKKKPKEDLDGKPYIMEYNRENSNQICERLEKLIKYIEKDKTILTYKECTTLKDSLQKIKGNHLTRETALKIIELEKVLEGLYEEAKDLDEKRLALSELTKMREKISDDVNDIYIDANKVNINIRPCIDNDSAIFCSKDFELQANNSQLNITQKQSFLDNIANSKPVSNNDMLIDNQSESDKLVVDYIRFLKICNLDRMTLMLSVNKKYKLTVRTTYGDIEIYNLNLSSLDAKTSTGDVTLGGVKVETSNVETSDGTVLRI